MSANRFYWIKVSNIDGKTTDIKVNWVELGIKDKIIFGVIFSNMNIIAIKIFD